MKAPPKDVITHSPIHYAETTYGFQFGAATVERDIAHKGGVWMRVSTPRGGIDIYVTRTGKIRVYRADGVSNGAELK